MVMLLKLSLLVICLLCGCTPKEKAEVPIKKKDIVIDDLFSIDSDTYLVYFYSEQCRHCLNIKDDMENFYSTYSGDMFFLSTDINEVNFNSMKSALIGVDNITDFYIVGTPSLIRFIDHKVDEYFLGEKEILEYISVAK